LGKCHGHGFGDGENHPQNSGGVDMETMGKQWIPYVMDDVKVCCFQASQHDRRFWCVSVGQLPLHPQGWTSCTVLILNSSAMMTNRAAKFWTHGQKKNPVAPVEQGDPGKSRWI
jgi:hypothetical protein